MWLPGNQEVCAVLMLITMGQALLIVGPKTIRANRDYTLVVSNFVGEVNTAALLLRLEGHDDDGHTLLSLNRSIDVRLNTNKLTSFKMPPIAGNADFKITIEGVGGFVYHKEIELEYKPNSIDGLIQLSKPVYKPGDNVEFRVIVLDCDLKPPSGLKMVTVSVQDSVGNDIRKWSDAPLYNGVFEGQLDIAPSPLLGEYNIKVEANNEELVSKSFEVKEYVLSAYELHVHPTVVPLEEHQALNLTIAANYYFGKPVIGRAQVQLYDEDNELELSKEYDVNGMLQVHLPFEELILFEEEQDFKVKVSFTEQHTNRTVVQVQHITVYKRKYQIKLEKETPTFHPGSPFKCLLKVEHRDGTPAKGVTVLVQIVGLDMSNLQQNYTSDDTGAIKLQLNTPVSAEGFEIIASIGDQELVGEFISKMNQIENKFIKIELSNRMVSLHDSMQFVVSCSDPMTFLVYYVVSKGNIVDSGFALPGKLSKYIMNLKTTEKMMPRSNVIVATITNNIVVFDYVDIEFNEFQNKFDMRINATQVKPGGNVEITIDGNPDAYVALTSYDESLHQHGRDHDVIREDIWKLFDSFHVIQTTHDKIHNMGLFARTLDGVTIDTVNDKFTRNAARNEGQNRNGLHTGRTSFYESWLWKNLTLPSVGQSKLIEQVPDTITSWHLNGFSIHPVHGIGFIKKPIRFTTMQSFYIIENLPYSIKRYEKVELHFTLFNTLEVDYIADVTMFNDNNEFVFVGQPSEAKNSTKSVSIQSNVATPISFLVEAKKLGDITVRLKASIMLGVEDNVFQKVIPVTPEQMEVSNVQSRFFFFSEPNSQTYEIVLPYNRRLDFNSLKIHFSLNPNILTDVVGNLANLLQTVPTGSGKDNIVKFSSNIVALDYLIAIESTQTDVINGVKDYLQTGYQNQMNSRQTDGSFGGSVFLTAFIVNLLQTAAKYISVNESQVSRAYDWLATKQQSNGEYVEVGSIVHQNIRGELRQGLALTSFVMIAFLENQNQTTKHSTVIQRGMKYIADNLEEVTDSYELAIATYALWMSNHNLKTHALGALISLSDASGHSSQRYWPSSAHQIETTAYALLSLIEAGEYINGIRILRWLVQQRYTTGDFLGTQDTFVGLKAMAKLTQKINPSNNNYTVQLKTQNTVREYLIKSYDIGSIVQAALPKTTRTISVHIDGRGSGLMQVAYKYKLSLLYFEPSFKLVVAKMNSGDKDTLKLQICTSFIPKLTQARSNMALVEVTFPSGYETAADLIVEEPGINEIKKREIFYGATTAVLYYTDMGQEKNCFVITARKLKKQAIKRPSYVKVHDYYNPDFNAIQMYEIADEEVL